MVVSLIKEHTMNLGIATAAIGAPAPLPLDRQQAIENALSMALHYVRSTTCSVDQLRHAVAKTNRALTLLKHASQQANEIGRA
jgi:galactokinase